MKRTVIAIGMLTLVLSHGLYAGDLAAQTACPIDGKPVRLSLFVDKAGQRIYACSTQCVQLIKADPVAAISALKAKGEQPATLQTTCPSMADKPIRKSRFVDYEGHRIYLCCNTCVKRVTADPEKYLSKRLEAGVLVESYQTVCPVDGAKLSSKSLFVDHAGKRIYADTASCLDKIKADPATYITAQEDKGITLDKTPQ